MDYTSDNDMIPVYAQGYLHIYNSNQLKNIGPNWPDPKHKLYIWFNSDITGISLPIGLTGIDFGQVFNQHLNAIRWPKSITDLTFGNLFNNCINGIEWPINLSVLKFGNIFNQVITAWPKTLTVIYLGYEFRQDISSIEWPPNFCELQIGQHCMFFLGDTSIRKLLLHGNHPNIIFPESIQYLCINPLNVPPYDAQYDISALKMPDKLVTLEFGYTFNYIIDSIYFPETMHKLSFGVLFNQSLNNTKLPISLAELNFGVKFNHDISFISKLLNLIVLSLGEYFCQPINHVKFHVIDTINDHSNKITSHSNDFPKSLRLIHRYRAGDDTIVSYVYYLRPVGQFTKMTRH
jgi:hypothetical protein